MKNGYKLSFYYYGEQYEYKHFKTLEEALSSLAVINNFIQLTRAGVIGSVKLEETVMVDEDPYIYETVSYNEDK